MTDCAGCRHLEFLDPVSQNDCFSAVCKRPPEELTGSRRTIAVAWKERPTGLISPAWCRGKEKI